METETRMSLRSVAGLVPESSREISSQRAQHLSSANAASASVCVGVEHQSQVRVAVVAAHRWPTSSSSASASVHSAASVSAPTVLGRVECVVVVAASRDVFAVASSAPANANLSSLHPLGYTTNAVVWAAILDQCVCRSGACRQFDLLQLGNDDRQ